MADTYGAFFAKKAGSLELSAQSLKVRGEKNTEIMLTHVVGFEKVGAAPMGKVNVELRYYDAFGNAETLSFAMREADFHALKKKLGK